MQDDEGEFFAGGKKERGLGRRRCAEAEQACEAEHTGPVEQHEASQQS